MKMFVHTFNTWFLAQLLHPVIFIIYFLLKNDLEGSEWAAAIFFISVFAFFASIPSLLIAWFFQYIITNTGFLAIEKLIAWIMSVAVAIFLNFVCLEFSFGFDIWNEIGDLMPPSVIATVLSILITSKQFFAFQLNYRQIKNENDVV